MNPDDIQYDLNRLDERLNRLEMQLGKLLERMDELETQLRKATQWEEAT